MNNDEKYKHLWEDDWESFEKYIYYNGEEIQNYPIHIGDSYGIPMYITLEIVKYIRVLDKHFMYYIIEGTTDAKMLKDHCSEYLPFYDDEKYIHINNHKIMSTPFEVELKQITIERWVSIDERN